VHPEPLNRTDVEFTLILQQRLRDMHLYTAIDRWILYLPAREQRRPPCLLSHHYTWICILGILSITKGFFSVGFHSCSNSNRTGQSNYKPEHIRCCSFFLYARIRSSWWLGAARQSSQTYDSRRRRDHEDIRW